MNPPFVKGAGGFPMKTKRFISFRLTGIQGKLGLILMLAVTVMFTAATLFYYSKIQSGMKAELFRLADFSAKNLSVSLMMPIWNFDEKTAEKIIDSVMSEKQVFAVTVKDKENIVLYAKTRDSAWNIVKTGKEISGNYFLKAEDISKDKDKIGTVEVYVTSELMRNALRNSLVRMLAVFLFSNALLFSILFFSIRKWVIFPVSHIIRGLSYGTEQIFSSSEQVASASQSLAEGTSEQAASGQEISASLEEVSAMVRQNADNAAKTDTFMKQTAQVVEKANQSVNRLTDSMEEIIRTSMETSGLVKTIDEIAFQTNLLALNAAIEAARAGQAGSGFAVVADEVRNLSMRAAQAARNTSDLLEGTLKKIETGGKIAVETREAFVQVSDYAHKAGGLIGEIAGTSQEQAVRIGHLSNAVSGTERITQNNASNAEETASASEEMKSQVEKIKILVSELTLLIGKNV